MNINKNDDFEISEINVTPFVDIMLVLLVIFMVTATFIVKEAIEVNLPKAASGSTITEKTLAIAINKEGKVFIDGSEVNETQLLEKVKTIKAENPEAQAIIGADKETSHGSVVGVLDILRTQGITKFAIQIEKKR